MLWFFYLRCGISICVVVFFVALPLWATVIHQTSRAKNISYQPLLIQNRFAAYSLTQFFSKLVFWTVLQMALTLLQLLLQLAQDFMIVTSEIVCSAQ